MRVTTSVKAGAAGDMKQHNEAQVRRCGLKVHASVNGLRVQTCIKAGFHFVIRHNSASLT